MKRSNTKQLIIDTASKLFYKNGYNLTGINEIIAEAGIAKATLYSHFKAKDELAVAYLEKRDRELLVGMEEFLSQKPLGNDRLMGVLEYLLSFYQEPEFAGCWCIRTYAEIPAENELIRGKIRQLKGIYLTFLRNLVLINRPDLNPESQEQLAKRLYLIYEGAVSESHLQNDAWPIHEAMSLLQLILER